MAAETPKYTGPGSCASPSCHGGVQARSGTSVWQNEYSTWVVKDKHAQAYTVLSNPGAMRMAKILGIESASAAPKCLACHALNVPAEARARTFDLTDGVSCESCHGPASNWLGPHTTQGWTHQQSMDAGMYDDRDLIHRSEKCLSCHLGTAEKFVDHEMIAAGHPDLYFELASFQAVMPRHWKEALDKDPSLDVRALAVGQAVQMREQLAKVAREAQGGAWPEFAELDCFACHHSLTAAKDSWRQQLGYTGRKPGNPPWNLSRYVILRHVADEADRATGQQLASQVEGLYALVSAPASDRAQIASRAASASETANRLAQKMSTTQLDAERLLKNIAGDADYIAGQGERSAEQAAMALDALFVSLTAQKRVENAEQIRAAIQGLFKQVEDPSSYNAYKFAAQMRTVRELLK
jgi:cytochrome c554/c'-like protein